MVECNIYSCASGRTFSMKPIFFGGTAATSPLVVPDMRSLLLLLPPPTPWSSSPRRRSSYLRPRHRGDDDDDHDDDEASREGRGAVAMDEKPDDVRQHPASRTTQVVATIGL